MLIRRMVASTLAGLIILSLVQTGVATDATIDNSIEITEITNNEIDKIVAVGVPDISEQLNDLYIQVGKSLNIDYMYVKVLHLLAGGKAVYADKRPNIYSELTVDSVSAPFDIQGANQSYNLEAPWVTCPDESIKRTDKRYLPDAAYSVTADIVKLMNQRYYIDRGSMQYYFDLLSNDIKTNIVFCEAVLEYIGSSREAIESLYPTYEKILYEKEKDENVVENNNGKFAIKEKFLNILKANNLSDTRDLEVLTMILSFDGKLAASANPEYLTDDYDIPYKLDYTSRENMMLAAMSVVGKVRYVWGGGHLGSSSFDGINPAWKAFYDTYPTEEGEPGYNKCIKPTSSWCPIHGLVENANGCLFESKTVSSVEGYVATLKNIADTTSLEDERYLEFMEDVRLGSGITAHRLDGLDCSGYASWLFNQITSKRNYDSGACKFVQNCGLQSIPYGDAMLPGDVFCWTDHIVVIVGLAKRGSDAYVMVEASPNTVKFGVCYYGATAKQSDINRALEIAKQANDLIGGLPITERTHIYNMDRLGYVSELDGNGVEVTYRNANIGRLNYSFKDENIIISEYNKKIKNMDALEIIQYTIDNLSYQYLTGARTYTGNLFDVPVNPSMADMELDDTLLITNDMVMKTVKSSDEVQTLHDDLGEHSLIVADNTDELLGDSTDSFT